LTVPLSSGRRRERPHAPPGRRACQESPARRIFSEITRSPSKRPEFSATDTQASGEIVEAAGTADEDVRILEQIREDWWRRRESCRFRRGRRPTPVCLATLPTNTSMTRPAFAVFRRSASGRASCPFQSRHIAGDQRFFLCSRPTLQVPFTCECVVSEVL
jgi:hypothetical protein